MPKLSKSPKNKTTQADHPEQLPLPSEVALDTLAEHLGKPDEGFRRRRFRHLAEADLVAAGGKVDSQAIVDDVPGFVGSALAIRRDLGPGQRGLVKLPDGLLTLIVDETVHLRGLKVDHDAAVTAAAGGKADRDEVARRERREGMHLRDVVYDGLRNALGEARVARLDKLYGDAESAERLAKALGSYAELIDEVREEGDEDDVASLDEFDVGEACADALREKAARVRKAGEVTASPARQVTQRALDLQDGRVLCLIEITMRAFRAAHRSDASIRVPKLGRIAWMFETRAGRRKAAKETPADQPTAPAVG